MGVEELKNPQDGEGGTPLEALLDSEFMDIRRVRSSWLSLWPCVRSLSWLAFQRWGKTGKTDRACEGHDGRAQTQKNCQLGFSRMHPLRSVKASIDENFHPDKPRKPSKHQSSSSSPSQLSMILVTFHLRCYSSESFAFFSNQIRCTESDRDGNCCKVVHCPPHHIAPFSIGTSGRPLLPDV